VIDAMDVARKRSTSRSSLKWAAIGLVVAGLGAAVTTGLSQLEPALPTFDRSIAVLDTVQRGTMVRDVKGMGVLVPVDVKWVTAEVGGQVVEVFIEPGVEVTPDTNLVRLHDPQLEWPVREAERDLAAANADLRRFQLQQEALQFNLKVEIATARANYEEARDQAEIDEAMARSGIKSPRQWQFAVDRSERNEMLYEVQVEHAAITMKTQEIQLQDKQDAIARAQDWLSERREQLASLIVKAGTTGVLQQLGQGGTGLEIGQRFGPGTVIAKISNPRQLKAVIYVPQVQARELVEGQQAKVDTLNGIVEGVVSRVDAQVQNERVLVEIKLTGELPEGARPDLSVQAQIEVARLKDVLHVRKPPFSQENGRLEVFLLHADGETASRTNVEFGRGAEYSIEVISGLKEGDQIVVSDTSRWKSHASVRLK
jgi:HlyD family secretion protein